MNKNFLKSVALGVMSLSLAASCSMLGGKKEANNCGAKNGCAAKKDEAHKCSAAKTKEVKGKKAKKAKTAEVKSEVKAN